MAFIKADLDKELEKLNELVNDNEDAKKAYEAFQKRIALQEQLIQIRKAENMTQTDVANAAGLSQQAVSRIEKGSGATINSLIKYLTGIGYCIQFKNLIITGFNSSCSNNPLNLEKVFPFTFISSILT